MCYKGFAEPRLQYKHPTKQFRLFLYAYIWNKGKVRNSIAMDNEPHIGHIIKQELRRQGRTITWLATQLGYSRQNMYKLFERKWIYTDLLLKISDIMDNDFFKCYSEYIEGKMN